MKAEGVNCANVITTLVGFSKIRKIKLQIHTKLLCDDNMYMTEDQKIGFYR